MAEDLTGLNCPLADGADFPPEGVELSGLTEMVDLVHVRCVGSCNIVPKCHLFLGDFQISISVELQLVNIYLNQYCIFIKSANIQIINQIKRTIMFGTTQTTKVNKSLQICTKTSQTTNVNK